MIKRALLIIALLPGIACAEQQNLNYTTKTDWKTEGPKVQNNFIELYTNKEPSVYVGETAPADTTRLFLDSNEEAGVLVQKKYVTGTGWVRVGRCEVYTGALRPTGNGKAPLLLVHSKQQYSVM